MAFLNRFGSVVRQNMSNNSVSVGQVPTASMLNAIRCMSSKLFIGGLSYGTDDLSLKEAFSSFGDVVDARVIIDRDSGKSRGFGFVSYADAESAQTAKNSMDGKELQGRAIRVSDANERPPRTGGFNGGGYGGNSGAYGNSGGGY